MSRWTKSLNFMALSFLLITTAFGDDLAGSFKEAAARGDAQEHATATKEYFTKTLLPYYGQRYASVLQSCFSKIAMPDDSPFSFVAAIGADGRIMRLYQNHETNIFLCLRDTLAKDVFPAPPVSPYYLHIDMTFTDGPKQPSKTDAPPLVLEPDKYSYTFGVPGGWDFSLEDAPEFGARLVFFPKGGSFHQSSSIIYVTELCTAGCARTAVQAIDETIKAARDASPTLQVAVGNPLKIKGGADAPVRILSGAKDPRQAREALSFIAHSEVTVLVVLTTKDTSTWDQDYEVFREVISGHKFFSCNSPDLAVPCR